MKHAFYDLEQHAERTALRDGKHSITYASLAQHADKLVAPLGQGKKLVFILMSNDVNCIAAYLGCLRNGHCALLLAADIGNDKLASLTSRYKPDAVMTSERLTLCENVHRISPPDSLALLLSTSGSTGSAKLVALSLTNLSTNAESIVASLPIKNSDVAITMLPLNYSYGLSVLNTHLLVGAAIVVTKATVMQRDFWTQVETHKVTSLAGVPHSYQLLDRLRFFNNDWPTIRYITQAGGKLPRHIAEHIANWANQYDKAFFIMYGQTEATARIACLDWPGALKKPNAIGKAIPGGLLQLRDDDGSVIQACDKEGELFYSGPNVMLGYIESLDDFSSLSSMHWLATGDLAKMDAQGDFTITGRKKRFLKLFGERLSLDEVEHWLHSQSIAAVCIGSDAELGVLVVSDEVSNALIMQVAEFCGIHHSVIKVCKIPEIPRLQNGKVDYSAAQRLLEYSE
ncbi:AMP-binding protein [Aestuariibacter salexigens]|uniref:AMP-binding protein n=1 Tax=Aestuariibacter salexigens TaxID=226010 RepID=UPI0004067C8C|nr:AMP-binding protein [Aestuariibacter salexigens]